MAFKMIPLVMIYLLVIKVADAKIGINWGRQNAQRLLPSNVVDLMMQNQIPAARIFNGEVEMLKTFDGSGIELTLNIPDAKPYKTYEQANSWVQMRKPFFNTSTVRQIYIADFSLVMGLFNKEMANDVLEAMQTMQKVIYDEGYGDQIKVNCPNHKGLLKVNTTSLRPSEAEFIDQVKPELTKFIAFLRKNNAPFVITVSPISDVQEYKLDLNFAIPDNKTTFVVKDINGKVYTNMFELMHDSFVWALIKLKASDIKVIVAQVGWPTDGYPGANTTTAERFYKSLLPWVASNKGTPMRPGAPIDIFIQAITDENKMSYYGDASFTRHWGIYMSNGQPKYKIDLSGKGRDIYPAEAKGIMRMPERWCVFNGDRSNITKLKSQVDKACFQADCTAMAPGGSCSHLDFVQNVSYAFNVHFQFHFQNETECDFEGLGHMLTDDPSTPECVFPVEVVRSDRVALSGNGFHEMPNSSAIFVILFSVLGTLFWN